MIEWFDENVIPIIATCDFPCELKITMVADDKMVTGFLLREPFQECKKLMSVFNYLS